MARILLTEDDSSMRHFLDVALEKAGHEVTSCSNGLEAYEKLETNEKFDLLLADIVMPGMDGIELAQKATNLRPNLKVMFITGFSAIAVAIKDAEKEQTTSHVLSKPFHLNDLVNQIEDILAA